MRTLLVVVTLLSFAACTSPSVVDPNKLTLGTNWKIQSAAKVKGTGENLSTTNADTVGWYHASVPSTVMGTLTQDGLYKDIFVGDNIKRIDKTPFDSSWWYRTAFTLDQPAADQFTTLHFDGISYYANVWLNGKLIASKDKMYGSFKQFDFDVTNIVKAGDNILAVEVFRQRPGDFGIGFVDWNPRPPDESMGIWREVYLAVTKSVSLQHAVVDSKVNLTTLKEASLTIKTDLVNHSNKNVSGIVKGNIESIEFQFPVTINANETKSVSITDKDVEALHISNPRLWWCNNLGEPNLYKLQLQFVEDKTISDSTSVVFGIREISDFVDSSGYRGFTLNGKKVIIKGGGWTDDIFLRDSHESNETQIKYVKDMNLNTIRLEDVWGTSQDIYDLCDRYGIMVMVGWTCHWEWEVYVGKPCDDFGGIQTEAEMDLMVASLEDQVKWLRYHPSIISWFVGSDKLPKPALEERYKQLLAGIDTRPYLAAAADKKSTVSGPTGVKMNGPYEYEGPNYWYNDNENGGAFGFNTETGPGPQIPVKESILKMIPQDKLWPLNDTWNFHCTTAEEAFNKLDVFNEAVDARFGKSKDLDSYLLKSSVTQYEAMRPMFEAFRVNQSKTTGIVQWMLNSAWPSLYWHLYDYYLIPTSAYYAVKKANEPLQLVYNYGDNGVYVVNELNEDKKNLEATIQMYSVDGKLLSKQDEKISIASLTSSKFYDVKKFTDVVFLATTLRDDGKTIATNFYWLSAKQDEYKWDKTTWAFTPMKSYADFKTLNTMVAANVKVSYIKKDLGSDWLVDVTIQNGNGIAFFSDLQILNDAGSIIKPALWDDNYFSLVPNESRHVSCVVAKQALTKSGTLVFKGWNSAVQTLNLE